MRVRGKRVVLLEGRWIETIVVAVFEWSPVTLEQLCRKMSASPEGPSPSATYRALRRLQESGLVEARLAGESWRGPRLGRKAIAYVLTREGGKAAAALLEPKRKRLAKRELGRYLLMTRRGKTGHDMLLADFMAALWAALGQARATPWQLRLEECYGEAGATRRLVHLDTPGMRPDALLTFGMEIAGANAEPEAVDPEHSKAVRAQVFVEADMGTERPPVVLDKLRRYVSLIFRATSGGLTPSPDAHGGLPVVLFVCRTPRRALAVRRWMREAIAGRHAEFRSNMLGYGIRFEDLFVVTCPEWWETRGTMGEAYLTPGSRLRRRDLVGVGEGLSVRGLCGFVSLSATVHRLGADRTRGSAELELADLRTRVIPHLLSGKDINPSSLDQARGGARNLCDRLRSMRNPRHSLH